MSVNAFKGRKRKIDEAQNSEDDGGQSPKERKGEPALKAINSLMVQKLSAENWTFTNVAAEQNDDNEDDVSIQSEQSTTRGISWKGAVIQPESDGVTEVSIMCKRYTNDSRSDCETQTYHFLPSVVDKVHGDDTLISCCIKGCESKSSSDDASLLFYCLPTSASERILWSEILNKDFDDVSENKAQAICSKHFLTYQSSAGQKNVALPKAKTRRKRTFDMLLAEEAEKGKQGTATGRAKRTPKPNRNYDWAELMPLVKSEPDLFDEFEPPAPKSPAKPQNAARRGRKQSLDTKRESNEHDVQMEDFRTPHKETNDYGSDISSPSALRDRPPKPKGRPNKIRDMFSQTDGDLSFLAKPLREVKVQCNLTAEPLVSCSSCSSIDWMRFENLLLDCIALVEGAICNAVLTKCFKKILDDVTKPSYASNVLKILLGLERDILETSKDIVLVSSQDDYEEVEIENVIHQEQAPVTGLKEIIPKAWQKAKVVKEMRSANFVKEEDFLGLVAATERDDDEFDPDSYVREEEEREDDPNEDEDDDDDWDVKKEGDAAPGVKKKKSGPKRKKELMTEAGSQQGSSSKNNNSEEDVVLSRDPSPKMLLRLNRRRRSSADTRWVRRERKCTECGIVFSTQRKHDLHFRHAHLGVPPWLGCHECEDCGKTFTQKISLNVHRMFKHGAPRRFQCENCSYEGPTKEYLKRHMKVHTGEKQYICKECGKGLKTAESYKNHLVLHTNEGRFFCQFCKKAFNHKGAFRDHVQSHQDNRDYSCNYCGASFKAYKHVARHIRAVHLNDKRFICDICGTQHMTGFNLKNHMKKHGDVPFLPYSYQCSGCEAKFRGFQGLASHLRVVHNTKLEAGCDETSDQPLTTPHPTRRPIKYQYSRISSSMLADEPYTDPKSTSEPETMHFEEEGYIVCEVKNETIDICDQDFEDQEGDENLLVTDKDGGEQRVIRLFPCAECPAMFTCEASREAHWEGVHRNFLATLPE